MIKKFSIYLITFIVLGLILAYFFLPSTIKEESLATEQKKADVLIHISDEEISKLRLTTNEIGPQKLTLLLPTRGKIVLHPDKQASIVTKMSGIVKEIKKNLGENVYAEEIVAVLESQEMAEAKANFLSALSKEKYRQTIFNREKQLYNKKISSAQEYFTAETDYEKALIDTSTAKQKLKALGLSQDEIELFMLDENAELRIYEVKAPIDGKVINRSITRGEFVESGATLYEIVHLDPIWVEIGIYPQDLFKVKEGQMVSVYLPSGELISEGKMIYISPKISDETFISTAIAELSNKQGAWRPGMFVNVDIKAGEILADLAVPKSALQTISGQSCLFIRKTEGFEKRFVKLGYQDAKYVEILSGLERGEQCVANQAFLLKAEMGKDSLKDDD